MFDLPADEVVAFFKDKLGDFQVFRDTAEDRERGVWDTSNTKYYNKNSGRLLLPVAPELEKRRWDSGEWVDEVWTVREV